ncbi:hypothetical protein FN846DRAFT_895972 [Sphaerosporella brunnea]|uniref:Uncharacterized protein n=1 Tax=Sphaerosporella brunnea TaxID=1250544 RepID=A0A5J5EEH1_9PEZI|nr:hypothetical protein FN846DRAFT_895972 [Sphaerosporella brunnea]
MIYPFYRWLGTPNSRPGFMGDRVTPSESSQPAPATTYHPPLPILRPQPRRSPSYAHHPTTPPLPKHTAARLQPEVSGPSPPAECGYCSRISCGFSLSPHPAAPQTTPTTPPLPKPHPLPRRSPNHVYHPAAPQTKHTAARLQPEVSGPSPLVITTVSERKTGLPPELKLGKQALWVSEGFYYLCVSEGEGFYYLWVSEGFYYLWVSESFYYLWVSEGFYYLCVSEGKGFYYLWVSEGFYYFF